MWSDIKSSYGVGFRFALAFPLIFLIPPVVEFVQHIIEWRIGMFEGLGQAEALATHPARTGFGYVKFAALLIVGLWLSRFIHSGGDRRATAAVAPGTITAFIPVIIVFLALDFGQGALKPWTGADALGQAGAAIAGIGLFLLGSILQVLLAGWRVGVALGDRRMRFLASIRKSLPVLFPGMALYFVVFLPLLVLHELMNLGMILSGEGPAMWALFVADSLFVGLIAAALWNVFHAIYRRALEKAGEPPLAL